MLISSRKRLTAARRASLGITLIEVMMSTMVVSLGILGLVSLIPLGTHLTERGTRADRIASLGERIYHEAMIRGAFSPGNWVIPTGATSASNTEIWLPGMSLPVNPPIHLPARQPYMIDPMFFGANGTDATRRYFPYPIEMAFKATGTNSLNFQTTTKPMRMWRVSLRRSSALSPMSLPHAKLAFQSDDDLSIVRPDDGELPPFQQFFMRGSTPTAVRRQAFGEYTWMIMLTPDAFDVNRVSYMTAAAHPSPQSQWLQPPVSLGDLSSSTDFQKTALASATDEYTASIIIMKNRQGRIPKDDSTDTSFTDDLRDGDRESELANERVLQVDTGTFISSGGYSTGEIQLRLENSSLEQAEEQILKLSNGDWICLAGRLSENNNLPRGDVYQWYRVVMVDDIVSVSTTTFTRRVTISGPDWSSDVGDPTHAIIVDGVVGVYQKRVRLESRSPWTP